jgi:hypothetical protein
MNNNLPEIFDKLVTLMNFASGWFNQYIVSTAGAFIKAIGILLINIFQFFIDVLQWVISHL